MRKALNVSRSTIEAARAELGDAFEFQDEAAPGQPFYVYSPGWLPAFHEWRRARKGKRSTTAPVDDAVAQEMQQIRLANMRLDLEERQIAHGQRTGSLLATAEVDAMFRHFLGGIRRFADYQLSDAQKIEFTQLLNEVVDEYKTTYPERIASSEGVPVHGGHRDGRSGGSEAPRRRAKGSRPGKAAARA